uniref:Uncharacterized protein n=1 Tax=Ixodes ricinus TaxID=34613 RepID=A0A6B0UHJ0_IXORI
MGTPAPRSAPASSVATLGLAGLAAPGCFHHFHSLFFLAPFSRVRVVRVSRAARVAGVASCFCPARKQKAKFTEGNAPMWLRRRSTRDVWRART